MSASWGEAGAFVVFGATGGIGGAVARDLLSRGARVVATGRDPERLAALDLSAQARRTTCDVTRPEQVEAALELGRDFGRGELAGIALCVGSILLKPAHLTTHDQWQEVLTLNLTSAFHVARAAGKSTRRGGSEMMTSSEPVLEASRDMHALGRIGEPRDVASAIVWLLDPGNGWISGNVLRVDGGLARLRPTTRRGIRRSP